MLQQPEHYLVRIVNPKTSFSRKEHFVKSGLDLLKLSAEVFLTAILLAMVILLANKGIGYFNKSAKQITSAKQSLGQLDSKFDNEILEGTKIIEYYRMYGDKYAFYVTTGEMSAHNLGYYRYGAESGSHAVGKREYENPVSAYYFNKDADYKSVLVKTAGETTGFYFVQITT